MIAELIDTFTITAQTVLDCLETTQKWFMAKPEVAGPKLDDATQKIKFATSDFQLVAMNVFLKDNVVQELTRMHSAGFEGFLDQTDAAYQEKVHHTNELIAPYRTMIASLSPITSVQTMILNQAQMKKIPLRYDDIKANMTKAKQLLGEMNTIIEQMLAFAVGKAAETAA